MTKQLHFFSVWYCNSVSADGSLEQGLPPSSLQVTILANPFWLDLAISPPSNKGLKGQKSDPIESPRSLTAVEIANAFSSFLWNPCCCCPAT